LSWRDDNREEAPAEGFRVANDPIIAVENLSFSYDGQANALQDVTLRINAGERVGFVGPNGSGKSTFFLCLMGVLRGGRGRIEIAGLSPADGRQLPALRRKVGLVFQNCDDQLFNPTVLDDVAFGPLNLGATRERARQTATEAIRRVGLPDGLLDRPPHRLSNGQKRRVALAGILAMNPEVLLLDEPASDLDPRGRSELIELLDGLGRTQLIAGHDLELMRKLCGRVVVLEAGRIVADGPIDQVLADEALMNAHGLYVPHSLRRGHDHGAGAFRHPPANHTHDSEHDATDPHHA
jgi:cobalt/nickel transport system ATP-binding protein